MEWTLGSEGREHPGTNVIPAGTGHAVDIEGHATACGRPYRSLEVWPDIPWPRVGMLGLLRCPGCVAEAG